MKAAAGLLVLLLVTFVSGLRFKANVNVSINANTDGSWKYRNTGLKAIDGVEFSAVYYTSRSITRDKEQRSWNVSGIFGAGVFLLTQVPFSFVAAYEADRQFNGGNGAGFQKIDAADALAYMGTAYARIEERSPNGSVVSVQSLRYNRNLQYSVDAKYKDEALEATSVVGRPSTGSWTINITFIASSVVGVLDLANAIVGPSSFEQVVQINNWPYQDAQNHITLVMVTASGSSSSSSDRYITSVVSGSGSTQVYFTASSSAVINGNNVNVKVNTQTSASVESDLSDQTFFLSQAASKYGSISFTTVSVDFPAGASAIAYDPSVGSGQPVSGESASSPASTLVVSSFALFFVLVSLLL